jgi:hypothetical protein
MIRTVLLLATLVTLAACNTTSDAQDAAAACSGVRSARAHDYCVSNYVNNARIGRDAEWSAAGSAYLSSQSYRRSPTCMNIGGIVTCQ